MPRTLDKFVKEEEDWESYCERLEQHFITNGIERPVEGETAVQGAARIEEMKRAILLSSVGKEMYAVLKDLCEPKKPKEFTYEQLVEQFKMYFSPTPSVIAERHKFHRCKQEGETAAEFAAKLRKSTRYCEFGQFLDQALRDQFVNGLANQDIARVMYLEPKTLTFEKAVMLATTHETARDHAKIISLENSRPIPTNNVFEMKATSKGNNGMDNEEEELNSIQTQRYRGLTRSRQEESRRTAEGKCGCCGRLGHNSKQCRYKMYRCHNCKGMGHLKNMCSNKETENTRKVNQIEAQEMEENYFPMYHFNNQGREPWLIDVSIGEQILTMEIDTGSAISAISEDLFKTKFINYALQKSSVKLKVYDQGYICPLGIIKVKVTYNKNKKLLDLFVVPKGGPPLLGRDWYHELELPIPTYKLCKIEEQGTKELALLLGDYKEMFNGSLGTFVNSKAVLKLKDGAQAVWLPSRPLAFAMKAKVDAELDRLIELGIIRQVQFSRWATPIVPVAKSDGGVRICCDFKLTVNPNLTVEKYPLPRIQELFAKLKGGKHFSKLDLSQAFQQLELEEESQEYCTINTHRGLFRYSRLPFGVASAPAIFQKTMDQVLQGLEGIVYFQDDILVTGNNMCKHLENLKRVLDRLNTLGFKVNRNKCKFLLPSVEFLGHTIDEEGLHMSKDKVRAVLKAPRPKGVSQLRSFLGLVDYYAKFLPNLSTVMAPLHQLLRKEAKWVWTVECNQSFEKVKKMLTSPQVLVHYNEELPIKLTCDASPYGVGAVISHIFKNGEERPIAYASRSLSETEAKYAQIDREALALVFGVKKFVQYIYGKKFILSTDHKPLLYILGEKKGIPQLAANRLQRWAIMLQGFDYDIQYVKGNQIGNADALSRLPLTEENPQTKEFSYLTMGEQEFLPITVARIRRESSRDSGISKVMDYCMHGWPEMKCDGDELKGFWIRREQLSIEEGCLMWGQRVIIPRSLQNKVLKELHAGHFGICKMKSLARSYVWWPKLDADLENLVKGCQPCLQNKTSPSKSMLIPWAWPSRPWQRIHVDLAGPFMGKTFLVAIDSYSKWPEVQEVRGVAADTIISKLRGWFATFGLPEQIVSDNGRQFTADEFGEFCAQNGIRHTFSPPYHPGTNGAAENLVKSFKNKLKTFVCSGVSLKVALPRFLMNYRITPHTTTGESPSSLMFGRTIRSRLTLLKPNLGERVRNKQVEQCENGGKRRATFEEGSTVMTRDYKNQIWVPGVISTVRGPLAYDVETEQGDWHRHVDQVISYGAEEKRDTRLVENGKEIVQGENVREGVKEIEKSVIPLRQQNEPDGTTGQKQDERRYPLRQRIPKKIIDV